MKLNKNEGLLKSFIEYCEKYPEQRFWQALRNFSGYNFVGWKETREGDFHDTFYYKGLHEVQEKKET